MKITNLLEATIASMPEPGQVSFRSGRNETSLEEMTAGSVASVAMPMGKVIKRKSGISQGIKKSVDEGAINENDLSEENLLAKQRQIELFKKAKLRDLGKRIKISDVLLKKQIEQAILDKMDMMEEDDNDFWYHGPHAVAKELHRIHNKHTITTEDINQLWEGYPPTHISVINNKPFMEKPDVATILKAHKELIESGELL